MSTTVGTAAEGGQWISPADVAELARRSRDASERDVSDHDRAPWLMSGSALR